MAPKVCHDMRDIESPDPSLFSCVCQIAGIWHDGDMSDHPKNNGENWLPHYVDLAGTNGNQLSKAVGTDRQRISMLLKRTKALPKDWADRIAPHLGVSSIELVHGPGDQPIRAYGERQPEVIEARVCGQVAAGVWLEDSFIDGRVYDPVPIVLARYPTVPQTAFKVLGQSMDLLRIFDGEYVITVPYWEARTTFQNKDIVVVERREGHKYERTCKQLMVFNDRVELWSRSTQDGFKEPLVVPLKRTGELQGAEVEVIGLVIGKHTVM